MAEQTTGIWYFGNPVIDSLNVGRAWIGSDLTYSFAYSDINGNGVPDMDEGDWKPFYREIIANIESFTALRFTEVAWDGNLSFRLEEGGGGESVLPWVGVTSADSVIGINANVAGSAAAVRLGTYSETWFHETGHALGLKHTHDLDFGNVLDGATWAGDPGRHQLNSQLYSVMTYTSPFLGEDNPFTPWVDYGTPLNAQPGSYAAIDIAALQAMYGRSENATGDTVYRFGDDVDFNHGYTTIWDTGGIDSIAYVGDVRSKIDLRAATLKEEIGGGGWVSTSETFTGGFTIANGVTIENAVGGHAADILIGNDIANRLDGGAGDDKLTGNGGDDALVGGTGFDTAVYAGNRADYTVIWNPAALNAGFSIRGAATGTDTLNGIEMLSFDDGTIAVADLMAALRARGGVGQQETVIPAVLAADIHGAFTATAQARFDDPAGGTWQRVFDFGNGPGQDNVFLGQRADSTDMMFAIWRDGRPYSITAANAIVAGETATWKVAVDDGGTMLLSKNGTLVAQGQGVVPADVARASELVGKSNWGWDTPLIGKVLDVTVAQNPADIHGAFVADVVARFDDPAGGAWQRVFDFGNGPERDNVFLGQRADSTDMVFSIWRDGEDHRITAKDAIVAGQDAHWTTSVDETGVMKLYKDGVLLAEGHGVVPADVVRTSELVGKSNWASDAPLLGSAGKVDVHAYSELNHAEGAFSVSAEARFDDLGHGWYQRIFDTGSGADTNNIWMGQVGNGADMAFEIIEDGIKHRLVAKHAITQSETALWQASVDEGGVMRIYKDGVLLTQGEGAVPSDVVRGYSLIGASNYASDTPLVGSVNHLEVQAHNAIPEIHGAFDAYATVRFDDLDAGGFQRVFDTGNGAGTDNIWLGQVGQSDTMAFEIFDKGVAHRIAAADAIVEGETATWHAGVDSHGLMQLFKNGTLLAQGQGEVPDDVARASDLVGASNWANDAHLKGIVHDLFFV
ncbi:M10 family metallopeptidase C-terminal domain-containing protein [Methylobacterium sp. J-059]|uniref:M10 family metallopeptidase C-terminal domain-containing protein n=1 Tax=Methylobacterium sp. J-059 TaxID=2836643 RepID=UPI001FBB32FE|nr:M10 family metallopeptidase C-terminal domain-containing protein [Methylobacterium sp. J-059]MCJ2039507.1 M10 family metallopeptidase C-terminal domain-containing protein [Methylobacterium sp. J-059]